MSSPTVLFVLDEIRRTSKGGRCATLAFGPGLAIEAGLIDLARSADDADAACVSTPGQLRRARD
jgi:hypothetical protein